MYEIRKVNENQLAGPLTGVQTKVSMDSEQIVRETKAQQVCQVLQHVGHVMEMFAHAQIHTYTHTHTHTHTHSLSLSLTHARIRACTGIFVCVSMPRHLTQHFLQRVLCRTLGT